MNQDLGQKLQELRKRYINAEDQRTLDNVERQLRRKIVESRLKEIPVVQDILKEAIRDIEQINYLLAYDEALTELERKVLFSERKTRQFYLDRFGANNAEQFIQELEKFTEDKLSAQE